MLEKWNLEFSKYFLLFSKLVFMAYLLLYGIHVFAADDILDGTADGLIATLNGEGKLYLYIAEGIISIAAYIKTKNLLFLSGIVVVSVFFNIMMTVSGAKP